MFSEADKLSSRARKILKHNMHTHSPKSDLAFLKLGCSFTAGLFN